MESEWDRLAPLMNAETERVFSERVLFMPVGGQPVYVQAEFISSFESIEFDGDVPVSTTRPVLDIILSSFHTMPKQDDLFRVGIGSLSTLYKVYDVNLDGNGGALLLLVEQDQEAV